MNTRTAKTPKAKAAKRGPAASNGTIPITPSIYRLAKQLEKDPEKLARRILEAGIEAIDNAIGNDCAPDFDPIIFFAGQANRSYRHRWTITGLIESLDPEELADCQKEAEDCGQPLQEIVQERAFRNVNMIELQ